MYTLDYFINKFSSIPDEKWCEGEYDVGYAKCAMGHCGYALEKAIANISDGYSEESKALQKLFNKTKTPAVEAINDGEYYQYQQDTPKERILAALNDLKNTQPREDITKELAVLPVDEVADVTVKELV